MTTHDQETKQIAKCMLQLVNTTWHTSHKRTQCSSCQLCSFLNMSLPMVMYQQFKWNDEPRLLLDTFFHQPQSQYHTLMNWTYPIIEKKTNKTSNIEEELQNYPKMLPKPRSSQSKYQTSWHDLPNRTWVTMMIPENWATLPRYSIFQQLRLVAISSPLETSIPWSRTR